MGVAVVRSWSPRGGSVGHCLTAKGNAVQADQSGYWGSPVAIRDGLRVAQPRNSLRARLQARPADVLPGAEIVNLYRQNNTCLAAC